MWVAHPSRPGLRLPLYRHHSLTCSHPPLQQSSPSFQFQKGPLRWIRKTHHWLPYSSYWGNTKYSLRGSLLLLILLKCSQNFHLFGRLGCLPKAWWSEKTELPVRDSCRARSKANRSEAHHLAYIEASLRAYSVNSRSKAETWQATCNNLSSRVC